MKYRLVDLLVCPSCRAYPLELSTLETAPFPAPPIASVRCSSHCAFDSTGHRPLSAASCAACYGVEILEGVLRCPKCTRAYPIIGGIPRFNADVVSDYPEFCRRALPASSQSDVVAFAQSHGETKRSFGYQWLRYRVTDDTENRDHFYRRTAVEPGTVSGQLFFDGGCGMGRYLKVIGAEPGAEVVGLDLSLAVNRAYEETRPNPFVHVIQGDLMQLPLRDRMVDHVYSIGVLHHTPDTKRAFVSISRLVKPGGKISIWVYHVWRWPELRGLAAWHASLKGCITDGLRFITTRLPHSLLNRLCYIAVPLGWLQRKIMQAPLPLRILFSPLLLVNVSVHPVWFVRILDTFDWYSPRYQWKHTVPEVAEWFREAGLTEIETSGFPVTVRGKSPASG